MEGDVLSCEFPHLREEQNLNETEDCVQNAEATSKHDIGQRSHVQAKLY